MARPLRIELAGGLYHVTSRGDRREAIYHNEQDRADWLDLLGHVCTRFNWRCYAYCEMTDHYHFLVETPEPNLSKGMRQLNGVYTQHINRQHDSVGHLFQGRFKAILVEKEAYLLNLARYIVLNPVRAKLVESAADWQWSSYAATAGKVTVPKWLDTQSILQPFGGRIKTMRSKYEAFVAEGMQQMPIWDNLRHQIFLGGSEFIERFAEQAHPSINSREVPKKQRQSLVKPLSYFAQAYPVRREAIARAFLTGVYSMQEIADFFGIHYSTVSRAVRWLEESQQMSSDSN